MKTKQITIKGFIHYRKPKWSGDSDYSFLAYDITDSEYADGRVMVQPHAIIVDVPVDFDPTPKLIASLEKEKAKVRKEFNDRIAQINNEIGKLQALTFDGVKS